MKILATNLSHLPFPTFGLNYTPLVGIPISEIAPLPMASMPTVTLASGTQPASAFDSITITLVGTTYTVLFGQSLPNGLPVQVSWAQNTDTSIVIVTDRLPGSGDDGH